MKHSYFKQFSLAYIICLANTKQFYLTLSGASNPVLSGTGRYDHECVLCISQRSSITGVSFGEILSLCWDAVGVFCSLSHMSLTRWGRLIPLYRFSRCILQPQLNGPNSLGKSYHSAKMQLVYSTASVTWA